MISLLIGRELELNEESCRTLGYAPCFMMLVTPIERAEPAKGDQPAVAGLLRHLNAMHPLVLGFFDNGVFTSRRYCARWPRWNTCEISMIREVVPVSLLVFFGLQRRMTP